MKKILLSASLFMGSIFMINAQTVLSEGFDDIATLEADGWVISNLSNPVGPIGWGQGVSSSFTSHEGEDNSFIGANFNSAGSGGDIDNWLITPVLTLEDGYVVKFWSRAALQILAADRLEVRLSTNGNSPLPASYNDVGDFTILLTTINPDLQLSTYPEVWTEYTLTLSGIGTSVQGRLAFRYFVNDNSTNSHYLAIDTFSVTTATASVDDVLTTTFSVYPNPAKDIINLSNSADTVENVTITDLNGRMVKQVVLSADKGQINIADLAQGVYILNATTNGKSLTRKIVKQ